MKPGTILAWSFMSALGLLGLSCIVILYPRTVITTTRSADALSPYGTWEAFIVETIYEPGFGGAEVLETVYVGSLENPGDIARVLTVETGGHDEAMPRLAWTGPSVLQITLNNQFPATVDRHADQGLRIDLRFDPDDPVSRGVRLKSSASPQDRSASPAR